MTNDLTTWMMLALAALVGAYFFVRIAVIARHTYKESRPRDARVTGAVSSARSPGPSTDSPATDDADSGHAIPF